MNDTQQPEVPQHDHDFALPYHQGSVWGAQCNYPGCSALMID